MRYVAVLPSIYAPWTERCLKTLDGRIARHLVVVDNTWDNKGVAASWNQGIDRMYKDDAQWLIIISAAIRFGASRGRDFIQALRDNPFALAIEASYGIGWHLIAFSRQVIDACGRFDENFYPAYYEDLDYAYRISKAFNLDAPFWLKVEVDASIAGFEHGLHLGKVEVDGPTLKQYLISKWGYPPQYEHPYNDPAKPIQYWHPTPKGVQSGY